ALEGLVRSNGGLALLRGHRAVLRSDLERVKGKVALLSGGGSGHEPAHAGYIGVGMLSGAVAGAVFASPPPGSVLAAILTLWKGGASGVLLIVKNYTGDRLNFGIAVEQARLQGAQVDMVIVADVCLSPCSVPGCLPSFQLPPGEMEQGLGIHGEPGIKRSKVASADEVVKTIISHMTDSSNKSHLYLKSGDKVVLCVNNIGALSCLEIAVVSKAAVHCLEECGVLVVRVMSGPFMTSLEMAGMSLSLMKVDEEMLRLFDAKTTAPAWPNLSTASVSGRNLKKNLLQLHTSSTQWCCSTGSLSSVIRLVLESVCRILLQHQEELNALDRAAGDGDCGSTHALIANGMAQTGRIPGNLGQLLADLALLVQERMGGSWGSRGLMLYCLFLSAAAPHLKQNCDGAAWAKALHAGTEAMKRSVTQVLAEHIESELFSLILWHSQYKMCQTINLVTCMKYKDVSFYCKCKYFLVFQQIWRC
uniref:Triokinase/FMN cyclase n=1 Tax=Sinocyclocheilus rhinocerous TaxID=307959 RepID=A0A673HFV6_9TELE